MKRYRWLAWCMNLVVLLALVAEGGHAHVNASDAAHPCAVCAVGTAIAVSTSPEPVVAAPQPTERLDAERPVPRPATRPLTIHASRGPPGSAR